MIDLIIAQLLEVKELRIEYLETLLDYEELMAQSTFSLDDLFPLEEISDALAKLPEISEHIRLVEQITRRILNIAPLSPPKSQEEPKKQRALTLIEQLGQVSPARLEAISLAIEFHQATLPTPARVVEAQPEMERAIEQFSQHVKGSRKVISRCTKNLHPIPTKDAPIGF